MSSATAAAPRAHVRLSRLPKAPVPRHLKYKKQTPGSAAHLLLPQSNPFSPRRVLDHGHPLAAAPGPPSRRLPAWPTWRDPGGAFTLRAVPRGLLRAPEPRDTFVYRPGYGPVPPRRWVVGADGVGRMVGDADSGAGADGDGRREGVKAGGGSAGRREVTGMSLQVWKSIKALHKTASVRKTIVTRVKVALAWIVTRGANVEGGAVAVVGKGRPGAEAGRETGDAPPRAPKDRRFGTEKGKTTPTPNPTVEVDKNLRLVFDDAQAGGERWVLADWTYILIPTLELFRMPYPALVQRLRPALASLLREGRRMEAGWGAGARGGVGSGGGGGGTGTRAGAGGRPSARTGAQAGPGGTAKAGPPTGLARQTQTHTEHTSALARAEAHKQEQEPPTTLATPLHAALSRACSTEPVEPFLSDDQLDLCAAAALACQAATEPVSDSDETDALATAVDALPTQLAAGHLASAAAADAATPLPPCARATLLPALAAHADELDALVARDHARAPGILAHLVARFADLAARSPRMVARHARQARRARLALWEAEAAGELRLGGRGGCFAVPSDGEMDAAIKWTWKEELGEDVRVLMEVAAEAEGPAALAARKVEEQDKIAAAWKAVTAKRRKAAMEAAEAEERAEEQEAVATEASAVDARPGLHTPVWNKLRAELSARSSAPGSAFLPIEERAPRSRRGAPRSGKHGRLSIEEEEEWQLARVPLSESEADACATPAPKSRAEMEAAFGLSPTRLARATQESKYSALADDEADGPLLRPVRASAERGTQPTPAPVHAVTGQMAIFPGFEWVLARAGAGADGPSPIPAFPRVPEEDEKVAGMLPIVARLLRKDAEGGDAEGVPAADTGSGAERDLAPTASGASLKLFFPESPPELDELDRAPTETAAVGRPQAARAPGGGDGTRRTRTRTMRAQPVRAPRAYVMPRARGGFVKLSPAALRRKT